ncbi:MAG: 4-(cytidine 5'-diphospho)-2-C-methyl-D-erythritol kinase [Bacteroidaceae bacterium]
MIQFPNAKINLGLHVTSRRDDGYHNLETVFYPIPLFDALEFVVQPHSKEKISLIISGLSVQGNPQENLVCKAYHLLADEFNLPSVTVYLKKIIPLGAGMGGGSSDATMMLKMLIDFFDLKISDEKLEVLAAKLGADCAFFVRNKSVFAEGIGNVFSPIACDLKGYQLLLIKPNVFVSTKDAFAHIIPRDKKSTLEEVNLREIIKEPVSKWRELMVNDFEQSVFIKFPILQLLKQELYNAGAEYAAMSGSGATVFGLFSPDNKIQLDQISVTKKKDTFVQLLTL